MAIKICLPMPSNTVQLIIDFPQQASRDQLRANEKTPLLLPPVQQMKQPVEELTNDTLDDILIDANQKAPDASDPKLTRQNSLINGVAEEESSKKIACQVFISFMISGFGTVALGHVLNIVQHWEVFHTVPEMFVLVPAVLGLRGNLEMTLASRISTQVNLGHMDSGKEQWRMARGNLALLQCQSLTLGFLAASLASVVGLSSQRHFGIHSFLLLTSSTLITASIASLLGLLVTVSLVLLCRRTNINPDNVAAPLASTLGDCLSLFLLATTATFLFRFANHNDNFVWIEGSIVFGFLLLIPMWGLFAYRCEYTRHVLRSGWLPVILAVGLSSGGGYVLDIAVAAYEGMVPYQPVINGVGGNLAAVQACRISTYLHARSTPGMTILDGGERVVPCVSPWTAWFGKNAHARTARIFTLMSIPGHLIFITSLYFMNNHDNAPMSYKFVFLYLSAAIVQVLLLLYLAHCLVHWLWRFRIDPDDAAIPYLTAMGDLLGSALLLVAFIVLSRV